MLRIILDTDPGIDDALALFLALASPEIQLEAVTTVSGNVPVEQGTQNALSLLTLTGHTTIPVAQGSSHPLVNAPVYAKHVHGANGLGNAVLPEPQVASVRQNAVELIVEKIMQAPGQITLVPIGPLTNIALALRHEPRIAQQVREVVLMGGAFQVPGNVTPSAEFNIYVDPHAAHTVFHAGWPLRIVSLDVTHQVFLQRAQLDHLLPTTGAIPEVIRQMLNYYFDVFAPQYAIPDFHMHDPLCLAAAFQPELVSWKSASVDVELTGTLTQGETVAYLRPENNRSPNAQISAGVASEQFLDLYFKRIQTLV